MARHSSSRVELIGFIGNDQADIKTHATGNGTPIINLRISENIEFTDKEDKEIRRTFWHDVKADGKLASEVIAKYAKQGHYVRIIGRLRYDKITVVRDGKEFEGRSAYIKIEEFSFLDAPPAAA